MQIPPCLWFPSVQGAQRPPDAQLLLRDLFHWVLGVWPHLCLLSCNGNLGYKATRPLWLHNIESQASCKTKKQPNMRQVARFATCGKDARGVFAAAASRFCQVAEWPR
ncbi:hypothetical protein GDO78_017534 [Eleutherodactylus coqui]|uniref:Uncharacterized protein n=1 Tax=Eleutherodactylus coqui TaxID=57060 RepID=A0A8J6B180_ELECQ|nr:hypothetical protein GDO78_017534 [Eleutherodactylus coqui]